MDDLSEKKDSDKRVYVVLSMFLKIRVGSAIPDFRKDAPAFWKYAMDHLRTAEGGDIGTISSPFLTTDLPFSSD